MVSSVFRHGARETEYPQYLKKEDKPLNKGELTSVGMRQQFNLGS